MFEFFKHQKKAKRMQVKLDAKAPKAGDSAPDFELLDVNGNNPVRLSDYEGKKPVGLIFGSFT
jgi:peroxiredoxin